MSDRSDNDRRDIARVLVPAFLQQSAVKFSPEENQHYAIQRAMSFILDRDFPNKSSPKTEEKLKEKYRFTRSEASLVAAYDNTHRQLPLKGSIGDKKTPSYATYPLSESEEDKLRNTYLEAQKFISRFLSSRQKPENDYER